MTPRIVFVLLILSVVLIACSKTEIVKIDTSEPAKELNKSAETTAEKPAETSPLAPSTGGAAVTTEAGKTVKKCDDTDLNDPDIIGRVRLTFTDGTMQDFYDTCNDIILTEYICEGKEVKSKNVICQSECFNINVQDTSCAGCKVGFCVD